MRFEIFVESLKEIFLNDWIIELFFYDVNLFFEFLILSDEIFKFILIDGKVGVAFWGDELLFKLIILFFQLFYCRIELLNWHGGTTLIGRLCVIGSLCISEKSLLRFYTMETLFWIFGSGWLVGHSYCSRSVWLIIVWRLRWSFNIFTVIGHWIFYCKYYEFI